MLFVWIGIVFVIAIIAAAVGFTDVAPGASEMARIVFYLILALSLLLLLIGFILIRKDTSFAPWLRHHDERRRTVGNDEWVNLLRKGRGSGDEAGQYVSEG